MQILQIDGTKLLGPGTFDRITNNDFGSTSEAFPSFTKASDVAAIYCKGNLTSYNTIQTNIAWMNPQNVFFYTDLSPCQTICHNEVSAGTKYFAIDIIGAHNTVEDNKFTAAATFGRGINMRTCSWSRIISNQFFGMDIAINASWTSTCNIEGNMIRIYNETTNPAIAINFGNCPFNNIIGNYFYDLGSNPTSYFTDSGNNSRQNQISDNYFFGANMTSLNCQDSDVVRNNYCWITENSGTQTISSSTSVAFNHGLDGIPTHVECGFKTAGYGSWIWSATSVQITITVNNTGTYNFSWYACIKKWN